MTISFIKISIGTSGILEMRLRNQTKIKLKGPFNTLIVPDISSQKTRHTGKLSKFNHWLRSLT